MTDRFLATSKKPRVGIVGAGVAGLRAAEVLLQNGAQVALLEARERLGGRLAQSSQLGYLVDLGPNWLQGANQDPILKLAHDTQTTVHSWPERQMTLGDNGDVLLDSEVTELQNVFWEIVGDAFRNSNEHFESIKPSESLRDFVHGEAQDKFLELPAEQARRKRDVLLQMADIWGTFVGNPIERQSLKFCWLEKSVEGEECFVAGTYANILERIAAPAVAGADLRFRRNVKQVTSHDDLTVEVTIEGQPSELFDEVLVTVPLGCLKADEPEFSPPLPSRLKQAISSIGYGSLDKVYITFPAAFWQKSRRDNHNVNGGQLDTNYAKLASQTAQDGETVPGVTCWLAPTYATTTNPKRWTQVCVNLAALPSASAHPTLLFYIFGLCAQHVAHLVSTTPQDKLEESLFDFFHPYVSRLPNYSDDDSDCKPTGILATAWANDKYAGHGSYSTFQVGLEQGAEDIECMREGLPERHIWFAGEHTAPFSVLGTVTGAYLAGEGVAKRIVEKWDLSG